MHTVGTGPGWTTRGDAGTPPAVGVPGSAGVPSAENCIHPNDLMTFFSACPARILDALLAVLAVAHGLWSGFRGKRSIQPWSRWARRCVRRTKTVHFRALRPLGTSHRRDQHGSSERLRVDGRVGGAQQCPRRRSLSFARGVDVIASPRRPDAVYAQRFGVGDHERRDGDGRMHPARGATLLEQKFWLTNPPSRLGGSGCPENSPYLDSVVEIGLARVAPTRVQFTCVQRDSAELRNREHVP